jgi:cytidine deaminase
VENASYGLTLCAECGLVSALHATAGGPREPASPESGPRESAPPVPVPVPVLVAVSVVAGDGEALAPCGRCRQLLLEAGGPSLLVDSGAGPVPLGELLPGSFGAADVASRREE